MHTIADGDLSGIASVLFWSAVLLAIIFAAFFCYTQFKRWMQAPEDTASAGFTLSDLRELHRQGKLSKEEFEAMKAKILANIKPAAADSPPTKPSRVKPSQNTTPDIDPEGGP